MRRCRFCGAGATRWWPYCTACDSLYGVPVAAWVIVVFLAIGVYAMCFGDAVTTFRNAH